MSRSVTVLDAGWTFKQIGTDEWLPVDRVPSNVHLDLLRNDRIKDPFLGFNELECEWVADKSWTYRLVLPPISRVKHGQRIILAMDGLDTYATVRIDGQTVLLSDNMWHIHRVDVTTMIAQEGDHILEIEFASARLEALKVKHAHPEHVWAGFMGTTSRQASRKAQYHWGWDWGPLLTTCGPWRELRIETYQTRISDIRVDYQVGPALKSISGHIVVSVEGGEGKAVNVSATAPTTGELVLDEWVQSAADGTAQLSFFITNPDLWFPHGYGDQAMYDIKATIVQDGVEQDSSQKRIGFRKAELVQQPDHIGRSFFFKINKVDIFSGGSNWIPADSFLPRISKDRYYEWLRLLIEGNQVMVRIWGGGIWEEDCFYDICDELGILVWQDCMFACGNYPTFPEMLKSIEVEATDQIKRIRHHPSIIVYAGNNEDYQMREQFGLTYDYENKNPEKWLKTDFPARYIYEKLLPDIVAEYTPHAAYHPGSPWGDGKLTTDPTVGDLHIWNVWHGTQQPYQTYNTLGGRFNAEFGMQAFPQIDTVKSFITDDSQLYPQSPMMEFHNKADGHQRRTATYLMDNFRVNMDLQWYIYLTQLTQAEALTYAYRGWRRQWGQQRHCGGVLVWQLNDCWPATSWSIVDYFLRKKPAYYTMRRALAPIAVAVERAHHGWTGYQARPAKTSAWKCWVVSGKTEALKGKVEVRFLSIASGNEIKARLVKQVEITANGTTDVFEGVVDNTAEEPHVLAARLWIGDTIIGRDTDFPQPLKYDDYSHRGVSVKQTHDRIVMSSEKPTKCLVIKESDGIGLSDNAIDLMPGDEQIIEIKGMNEGNAPLEWRYYSM